MELNDLSISSLEVPVNRRGWRAAAALNLSLTADIQAAFDVNDHGPRIDDLRLRARDEPLEVIGGCLARCAKHYNTTGRQVHGSVCATGNSELTFGDVNVCIVSCRECSGLSFVPGEGVACRRGYGGNIRESQRRLPELLVSRISRCPCTTEVDSWTLGVHHLRCIDEDRTRGRRKKRRAALDPVATLILAIRAILKECRIGVASHYAIGDVEIAVLVAIRPSHSIRILLVICADIAATAFIDRADLSLISTCG